ncbi:MAG: YdeI/OmpD-associated family protein [Bacteroidota bacterium]
MESIQSLYFIDRSEWRSWLETHFKTSPDIWLEYPKKHTGKPRILYNDAVEEALCFGWIDSTVKSQNPDTTIQRFCPRRANSSYSQANKERLKWLSEKGMIHSSLKSQVQAILSEPFHFPADILKALKADEEVWENYQQFSDPYKRIRIAYIESARKRPEEFAKRLRNFIEKTKEHKLIKGFGGIDKYY